ncbi:hypothetical protein H310_07041 [Aphanomyces invadans]|uniref:DDE-1 domain-containing protein n=1 Tax=Aphanomyces invadans TaxID=157072 RepID=A0A024U4A0_9STRA|nr:hypothetical protein H310_07041 [Aphanomyces invadans]ETW00403.1 hypothetical protein H310_07041 [Aphanomyces invadans]|eukprot:XP_008870538.1 hypothetical protein H310_07041 [Aphanomyces invadans]
MPPNYIWAKRGGSSKISAGEKHSMRMTAVLTARADDEKLPIMFIMKGKPGGRIETHESYLSNVLHDHIEEASVVILDNFESHVSDESYKIVQPLDVGVMAPFKRNTREHWL